MPYDGVPKSRDAHCEHTHAPMAPSKTMSKNMTVAEKAEAAAAKCRDTPEKKKARIAELEERARLFGDSVKQSYI